MSNATKLASLRVTPGADEIETRAPFLRAIAIGLVAFLTLVDLFANQAILPLLANAYRVTPGEMGLAVNASTIGMAVASLIVAFFSGSIDRAAGGCSRASPSLRFRHRSWRMLPIWPFLQAYAWLKGCAWRPLSL